MVSATKNYKIKITKDFYDKLKGDMNFFGLIRMTDQFRSIDNKLFTRLIINTYRYIHDHEDELASSVKDVINNDNIMRDNDIVKALRCNKKIFDAFAEDLSQRLVRNIKYEENPYSEKIDLFIRTTKENNDYITDIINEYNAGGYITDAMTLRNLLYNYISFPLYTRECICYYDNYLIMKSCKDNHKLARIKSINNKSQKLKIYDIIRGKDELRSYVIGVYEKDGEYKPACYKVSTIKDIINLQESFEFEEKDKTELISRLRKTGPEFFSSDEVIKAKIKFTDDGLRTYDSIYVGKPLPLLSESDPENKIYVFNAPFYKLKFYFTRFGADIEVLEPAEFKKEISDFHKGKTHTSNSDTPEQL